jgi:3-hydroxyacyl-[acyl-carrier-protein] dehydratase
LGEEYLADHFPTFPVMPGVLMLQTLVEAGAWLLRLTDDFASSVIVLREAKGVKYGTFMEPGRQMTVSVELVERGNALAVLKGKGEMEGQSTVSARLALAHYNLGDRDPTLRKIDDRLTQHLRELYGLLRLR